MRCQDWQAIRWHRRHHDPHVTGTGDIALFQRDAILSPSSFVDDNFLALLDEPAVVPRAVSSRRLVRTGWQGLLDNVGNP